MALQDDFSGIGSAVANKIAKSTEHNAIRMIAVAELKPGSSAKVTNGELAVGTHDQTDYGVIIDEYNTLEGSIKAGDMATCVTRGYVYVEATMAGISVGEKVKYDDTSSKWVADTSNGVAKFIVEEILDTEIITLRILDTSGTVTTTNP